MRRLKLLGAGQDGSRAVVVHGCFHTSNWGDLLLLELMTQHLRQRYNVRAICPALPAAERARVSAGPGRGVWSFLRPRVAIMSGGGYLNDRDGDPRQMRDLLRYSLPCRWWRATSVPYVVVGVGAGPWLSGVGAARVRTVCEGARAIAARDEESKQVLTAAGVPPGKIEVTADLAMALTRKDLPEAADADAEALLGPKPPGVRRLGIHLDSLVNQGPGLEKVLSAIVAELPEDGSVEPIWLVDRNGTEALRSRVQAFADRHFPSLRVLGLHPLLTTAGLIGRLDAVVTSKLHVGVTAWALGIPTCGYSTHPKTKRFYRQVGRESFQADVWDESPDVVRPWIKSFVEGATDFLTADADRGAALRALARRNLRSSTTISGRS